MFTRFARTKDIMPRKKSTTLTCVELEFMQALWEGGECTPDDIQSRLFEQGRNLSGGAIRKMLYILMEKGYVKRRREGKGHVYSAMVPQNHANKSLLVDLMRRAFDGSAYQMVSALIDTRSCSDEDIEKISRIIEQRKRNQ